MKEDGTAEEARGAAEETHGAADGAAEVGTMEMPPGFSYREVFLKGKPRHEQYDAFSVRHPKMDAGRRAKIFAPFDALKGFSDELAASERAAAGDITAREAGTESAGEAAGMPAEE